MHSKIPLENLIYEQKFSSVFSSLVPVILQQDKQYWESVEKAVKINQ